MLEILTLIREIVNQIMGLFVQFHFHRRESQICRDSVTNHRNIDG